MRSHTVRMCRQRSSRQRLYMSGLLLQLMLKKTETDDTSIQFRDAPLEFLREISRHYSGAGWRSYDNPIGQPVYYSGFTENMKNKIMNSPLLRKRIQELATSRVVVELKEGLLSGGLEKIKGGEAAKGKELEKRRETRLRELLASLNEVAAREIDGMICKMENKTFIRVGSG